MPITPEFKHDCDHCVFIGRVAGQDLYICTSLRFPQIVLRWGNDGPDYTSGFACPELEKGWPILREALEKIRKEAQP